MKSVSLPGLLNMRRLKESIVLFIEFVQQKEGGTRNSHVPDSMKHH